LAICETGAFTREELDAYDAYWDHVRIELSFAEAVEGYEKLRKVLEGKDKVIEDKDKALEEQRRIIEELKKQVAGIRN
jgi:hypothetical protein